MHDAYAALRSPDYRLFILSRNLAAIGSQVTGVALGWEIYQRTHEPLLLGGVGLVSTVPIIALALPAGHLADRMDRKRIMAWAQAITVIGSVCLAVLSLSHGAIGWFYLVLFGASAARAFSMPARSAMLPQLVPAKDFPNAVAWTTSAFQVTGMLGSTLGGLMLGVTGHAWSAYAVDAVCGALSLAALLPIRYAPPARIEKEPVTIRTLAAGLQFVWKTRIILGTLTLDLFAVLFGGAAALLPIYASDVLRVGAAGLGLMRAAPSAGALIMALTLTHVPLRRAGAAMLWAVSAFGAGTIVFGLSRWFPLSLLMLCTLGAADNISVVVRHTLVQTLTPDQMRGRVSAVNGIFISSSNGLGDFESGLVARYFGAVFSVVSGGIGTLLVVAAVALLVPAIRTYGVIRQFGDLPADQQDTGAESGKAGEGTG